MTMKYSLTPNTVVPDIEFCWFNKEGLIASVFFRPKVPLTVRNTLAMTLSLEVN